MEATVLTFFGHHTFLMLAAGGHENNSWHGILEILILLATAMLFGVIAERLKQSAIVGYLFAGAIVGPSLLGWVGNQQGKLSIAELGVALLLFTIGLELSPDQLKKLGRVPIISGPFQVLFTVLAGIGISMLVGLSFGAALVIGAMVSLSSTACVLRVLQDRSQMDSIFGRVSLGILLVQDAAVVVLVLLVSALGEGGNVAGIILKVIGSTALMLLFVIVFYFLFNKVIPKILVIDTWRRNRDLPVLLTVCLAGGSAWCAHALDLSPALGAFVAGVLLAVSPFAMQIHADIQPLRAVLVTMFFAAIGMFADVPWFITHIVQIAAALSIVLIGKITITAVLTYLAGMPLRFAVATGFCLAQIGEFSFVLATIAQSQNPEHPLLDEFTFQLMVSVSIMSLMATPYLLTYGPTVGIWIERVFKRMTSKSPATLPILEPEQLLETDQSAPRHDHDDRGRIMIIGFGPAGQRVAEELIGEEQYDVHVLDMNIDNVRVAKEYGLHSHVGDATQTETLLHVGITKAVCVVITIPEPVIARRIIHQVRQRAPQTLILVRGRYHIHTLGLFSAGAHYVIDEESNVGHRLATEVRELLSVMKTTKDVDDDALSERH
jgi:CPA2 family monovalent cation:H+ antiporter-2